MSKVSIEIDAAELERAITCLSPNDQLHMAKFLAARQMGIVTSKLHRTVKHKGLSPKTLDTIIERAREEVYHRRRH